MTTYSAGDGRIIIRCDAGQCITQVTVTAPTGEAARTIAALHDTGWYTRRRNRRVTDACQWHLGACCIHHARPGSPTLDPAAILPTPRLEPMSDQAAAWVREHAWTAEMRHLNETRPDYYPTCSCQQGPCHQCTRGAHDRCRPKLQHSREAMVCDRTGVAFAAFAEPYAHRTIDGPPLPTVVAQVWLADRVCRWTCPCTCTTRKRKPVYEAVALPGLELIGATT